MINPIVLNPDTTKACARPDVPPAACRLLGPRDLLVVPASPLLLESLERRAVSLTMYYLMR